MMLHKVIHGDCLEIMPQILDKSVDMILTSPPYANRRKNTYGGIPEEMYVEWFVPIAIEIRRILKPSGSFFLNIKPHTRRGCRSLYVNDLVARMVRGIGFLLVDEFCWTKNPFPGGYRGRFKNAFEPVYHFTLSNPNKITFNPLACGTPTKEGSIKRAFRKQCGAPENGSGMTGMNTTNFRHLKISRPSNVIHVDNVSNQFTLKSNHPATFPEGLAQFFIKSFSNKDDLILDPFAGSGTTGVACKNLKRNFILIEKEQKYIDIINQRLKDMK